MYVESHWFGASLMSLNRDGESPDHKSKETSWTKPAGVGALQHLCVPGSSMRTEGASISCLFMVGLPVIPLSAPSACVVFSEALLFYLGGNEPTEVPSVIKVGGPETPTLGSFVLLGWRIQYTVLIPVPLGLGPQTSSPSSYHFSEFTDDCLLCHLQGLQLCLGEGDGGKMGLYYFL